MRTERMVERGIYDLGVWVEGLKALPAPQAIPEPFVRLGFVEIPQDADAVKRRWRELVKVHHPDAGGDPREFETLALAYRQALELLEGAASGG